ncbi:MAG TPA: hypothetical protein VH136_02445, partial [Trebonia sp.]|nr:hypothetical protein [Trebonia sp.]
MSVSEPRIAPGDSSLQPHDPYSEIAEISEISDMSTRQDEAPAVSADQHEGGGTLLADGVTGAALPADRYLDREQSWVKFNQRVLDLAEGDETPLLERVRFLAIFASNLDEFFMVRVAGLTRRMVAGFPVEGAGEQLPVQVLKNTLRGAAELAERHSAVFTDLVQPELARHDIEILRWKELEERERDDLTRLFRDRIYPVLTPLVVDPAHPFPFISG